MEAGVETAALSLNFQSRPDAAGREAHDLLGLSGPAYRLAMRILGSRESAEDVVQGAYVVALERARSASPPLEMQTWFLGVVANLARLHRRRRSRRREKEAAMRRDQADASPQGTGLVTALGGAMAMLDEKYRLPVSLCYEEGLSQRQAAAVLKVPERTLSRYVNTGLVKLRNSLEHAGYPAAVAAVLGGLKQTAPAVPASLAGQVQTLVAQGAMKTGAGAAAASVSASAKGGIAMKLVAGVLVAGAVAAGVAVVVPGKGPPEPLPAEKPPENIPKVVLDESASRWVIDRFAGNSMAGPQFFQGPALQTGGLGTPCVAPAPDGSVFLSAGYEHKFAPHLISRVAPDGTLRLVAGGGSSLADGPAGTAQVRAGCLRYSAADKSLYFVHGTIPCVRRLYEKDGQWFVETVAGDPNKTGSVDGPGKAALFKEPRSLAITSTGTVYVLDGTNLLRKIEGDRVSTVVRFLVKQTCVDGPFDTATTHLLKMQGAIFLGENDETLYLSDAWHFVFRRIDLKAGTITTIAGMTTKTAGTDGPATTHASFRSGTASVCWDPVHKALWVCGPDESRLRWLKDGWVRTVLPFKRMNGWRVNGVGVKPAETDLVWCHVEAVDDKGRAYINAASSKTGVWRAYQKGGAR